MIQVDVVANSRDSFGKGASRSLRRGGQTPAILYGPTIEPKPLRVDTHSFTQTVLKLQRRNAVVMLDIDGAEKRSVIIKDLQVDPVHDTLRHADFCDIDLDKEYTFHVPLEFVGKAKGVEFGGILETNLYSVQIKGIPLNIPDSISVDITNLDIGDAITNADLDLPAGITLIDNPAKVCVTVLSA